MRQIYIASMLTRGPMAAFLTREDAEVATDALGTPCSIDVVPVLDATDVPAEAYEVMDVYERGEVEE